MSPLSFVTGRLWRRWPLVKCAAVLAGIIGLSACSDEATSPDVSPVYVRVVNSVFQTSGASAVPRAVDFFVSGATPPGFLAIPGGGASGADSAGGYRRVDPGVHTFVAKLAGDTTELFTTSTNRPYTPTQFIGAGTYYTIFLTGTIPASGLIPNNTIPFLMIRDDPYPGAVVAGARQARFRVVHAAPYGRGSIPFVGDLVQIYLTPGGAPPPRPIADYRAMAGAQYMQSPAYQNVAAGTYFITITQDATTLVAQPITLAAGEVRTFVLQSTAAGPPSAGNHTLTSLQDRLPAAP